MKLHYHTAYSAAISGILYSFFKSWELSCACFFSGILIDVDHFFDVIREHGWRIKIKDFFHLCHNGQFQRVFLLFHGWEWVAILGFASWASGWNPWITGIFIGTFQHMVLDACANAYSPLTYSIIWRWKRNFDFDSTFPKYVPIKYRYLK